MLAGALTYANSLSNPFVFDDTITILDNPQITELWSPSVLAPARELPVAGRPVANVTLAINYAMGGFDPTGYHAVNITLHVLCALVLFGCVRRVLALPWCPGWLSDASLVVAFAPALIWVVHPLNSEVVDYLTQRTESLMALFYLLTIYAGLRALGSPSPGRWTSLAVVACALGMGSKEAMATILVTVVLLDRVFVFATLRDAWQARWRLYAGLASTYLILLFILSTNPRPESAGFSSGVSAWTYLLNQPALITRYLGLVFWPHALVAHYGWPSSPSLAEVAPYALFVLALVALTAVALWKRPPLGFLGAWFFITLAPASSIVPVATEVGAERRMYLPLAALLVLAVVGTAWLWRRGGSRPVRWVAALAALGAIAAGLGARTWLRNQDYQSSLRLAEVTVERYPSPDGRHVLAEQLLLAGRRDEALTQLRAAVPDAPRAYFTLGKTLFEDGRLDDAIPELQAFIRLQPRLVTVMEAHGYLGKAFAAQGRWNEAIAEFEAILREVPYHPLAHYALGDILSATNRFGEAIPHYRAYLEDQPRDVEALSHLGLALGSLGRLSEAEEVFERAAALEPDNPAVRALQEDILAKRRSVTDRAGAGRRGPL